MVTRKSGPGNDPKDPDVPASVSVQGVRQALWSPEQEDLIGEQVWADAEARQDSQNEIGGHSTGPSSTQGVPSALRPGTAVSTSFDNEEQNPWDDVGSENPPVHSMDKPKIALEHVPTVLRPGGKIETNPFKRKPLAGSPGPQAPASASATPPSEAFAQLRLAEPEPSNNPWKPTSHETRPGLTPPPIPSVVDQETESDVWGSSPSRLPSSAPSAHSLVPVAVPSRADSPAWDEETSKPSLLSMPQRSPEEQEFSHDAHAWDDVGSRSKGKSPAVLPPGGQPISGEDWNLIDHEPLPEMPALSRQSTWENFEDEDDEAKNQKEASKPDRAEPETHLENPIVPSTDSEVRPALPPRRNLEIPPPQPPRPNTPSAANKTETYQIKNINWFDVTAAQNPRRSPILVQNANGPCPLVALVNALTLTTPAHLTNTVLVETLRSREQISLNLLLEAVFDELMSPRRTKPDAALPDVTELYAFLKGLHTGMNVNPRYIPTDEIVKAHKRTSLTHIHPSVRGDYIPGTFEDTRDMKLYATFSIPLIHGWLPPKDDPVYEAFERQATSYDDVQNLMFREEELEDKLSNEGAGLTEQEQQIYQDIMTIKSWLSFSATQLTPWGLEVVTKSIQPGTFSIMFRNDHFSTLYRHPQTMQLFTLVTDAGYYTHDEIVWESLVDVNGLRAEFSSGDFRLVGGTQQSNAVPEAWYDEDVASNAQNSSEWQTVQSRRGRNRSNQSNAEEPPRSPTTEQEDRDLALALQLQEEEDERHRTEQAARQRESQLSQNFIEQQGRSPPGGNNAHGRGNSISSRRGSGLVPARVSSSQTNLSSGRGSTTGVTGVRTGQQVRPLVPPANRTYRPPDNNEDEAPPSYEQASKSTPYVPPAGHPSHPSSHPSTTSTQASSSNTQPRQNIPPRGSSGLRTAGPSTMPPGPRRPMPVAASSGGPNGGRDKDCVVM
ncbi:hypothetical protein BX600DRAFT_147784 [Xylariales sp. PMI_506]|nr:hypothetical protein BX600DRAFT_147784 [Xylariales sp. PMI_506]